MASQVETLLGESNLKLLAWIHIQTPEQHQDALDMLQHLMLTVPDDPKHPHYPLIDFLGIAVERYEQAHYRLPTVSPIDLLKSLMRDHGLRQQDLPEIGNQAKVSEVLAGKRQLTVEQIKKLSKRFALSADCFMA